MKSFLTLFFLWAIFFGLLWIAPLQRHLELLMFFWGTLGLALFSSLLWKLSRVSRSNQNFKELIEDSLKELGSFHELGIFDSEGKTLLSTNSLYYPSQKEFLRKILARLAPSHESNYIKNLINEKKNGVALVYGGENGLEQKKTFWWAVVKPFGTIRKNLLVTLTECTKALEPFQNLRHRYDNLENFIDTAPFGLFYLNKTNHVVGVNQTLATWLCEEREKIIGRPVVEFMEVPSANGKPVLMNFKPFKHPSFQGVLFPAPSKQSSKVYAFVVCRLNLQNSGEENPLDYYKEDLFLKNPIPTILIEEKGEILAANLSFSTFLDDISAGQLEDKTSYQNLYDLIHPNFRRGLSHRVEKALHGACSPFEVSFLDDKSHATVCIAALPSPLEKTPKVLMVSFVDISAQKRLEEQFIQSQKMQAVGQLAGGIAHDFNNLLTAMIGFCDLLLQRYMPNDPSYTDILHIKQNANRASNLVRQLLAFSRQQTLQPRVIQMTDVLAELSALLRRLIGASIHLQMVYGRDLWTVKVDPGQLEQVIINLAVNARDAMTEGGNLTIRTSNFTNERSQYIGHDTMTPGDYVLIEVSDTGYGISPENMAHIFEPFFSTKQIGSGTGLGLSTVYGIIKQTEGFVGVESLEGKGTTFRVFLPRYQGVEPLQTSTPEPVKDLTGSGKILLVEDEDAVRLFSARALREKGYQVLEAENAQKALELIEEGAVFDLLVTDVVMPYMDGPTLCRKIREKRPDTKTIFISGYAEDTFRRNLDHDAHIHFLAKPFTLKDLAAKVKEVLKEGK